MFAMTIAIFILASESDDLTFFIVSKIISVAVFVYCAYDLNILNYKRKENKK